jgi:Zn-dependent protease
MKAGRPDEIFGPLIQINAGLGLLSLLPIPPLAGGEILRRGVDMSDRTFALLSRLGGLVLLLALNFETVQRALTLGLVTACWPFLQLCRALNPAAVPRLFG